MIKKLTNQLLSLIVLLGLNIAYLKPVLAETILEEIQRTGVLKVGVRSDAIPFGYRDNNKELRGICLDFISVLREQLKESIDREIILVKLFISTLYNRFEIVEDKIVHFECGPNTIREVEVISILCERQAWARILSDIGTLANGCKRTITARDRAGRGCGRLGRSHSRRLASVAHRTGPCEERSRPPRCRRGGRRRGRSIVRGP